MILITGASGFIGKHLVQSLIKKHGQDFVVALTSGPLNGVNYLLHNNYNFSSDYFTDNKLNLIEVIIHAGAFIPKRSGDANNILLCNSNIYTTEKLLQSNFPNLKKFIFLSTIDVYQTDEVISEETEISPASLYGLSKFYCEKIIESWGEKNQIDFQILRIGHVYGPGEENFEKIIPIAIRKILNKEIIEVHGDGTTLRSFIYIDDVVNAVQSSISCSKCESIINIVGGNPISIIDLISLISEFLDEKPEIRFITDRSKSRNLVFDNSKMIQYLKLVETPLEKGLVTEVRFMKNILNK